METSKLKLYIISGVTGAIGNALLARVLKEKGSIVYGLSRKACPYKFFMNTETHKFYKKTFICSIGKMMDRDIQNFYSLIDYHAFQDITYIHCLGHYPFEVDNLGNTLIENDADNDGINDLTMDLSYRLFKSMSDFLAVAAPTLKRTSIIFGSLADKHKPIAHGSWWKTLEKTKNYMKESSDKNRLMLLVNISSVICSHELISRPFVCVQTDANPQYWLTPHEVAESVYRTLQKNNLSYKEYELFNSLPGFTTNYYTDGVFTMRKVLELFKS